MAIGPFTLAGLPVFGDGLKRFILGGLTTGTTPPPPVTPGEVAGRWIIPSADAPSIDAGDLYKSATDRRWFVFDYGNMREVIGGHTLSNPSLSSVTAPLTITGPVVVGSTVGTWVENGIPGVTYDITVTVDFLDVALATVGTVQRTGRMRVI